MDLNDLSINTLKKDRKHAESIGCIIIDPVKYRKVRLDNNVSLTFWAICLIILIIALLIVTYRYGVVYDNIINICKETSNFNGCIDMFGV